MEEFELTTVLSEHSTKRYAMEYRGFLSNHMSHGIIALAKLGANKRRIEEFITWYSERLEKPSQQCSEVTLPENKSTDTFDYSSVLGKRISFFPILDYYDGLFTNECNDSMEKFISKYFPPMADGIGCSALHALIQAGYGYNAKNPRLVLEGIAYLHHSYLPIKFNRGNDFEFGKGTTDILDIADELGENKDLTEFMNFKAAQSFDWLLPNWKTGGFQKKLAVLLQLKGDELATYVSRIQLPEWFSITTEKMHDILKLADWVTDCAIAVYRLAEVKNDFFLVHGVTGAWSLRQLLSAFSDSQVKDALICIKLYLCILLAAYKVRGSPKIDRSSLNVTEEMPWDEIKQEALGREVDEHIYKLIQVCFERSRSYSDDQQHLFKSASVIALNNDLII